MIQWECKPTVVPDLYELGRAETPGEAEEGINVFGWAVAEEVGASRCVSSYTLQHNRSASANVYGWHNDTTPTILCVFGDEGGTEFITQEGIFVSTPGVIYLLRTPIPHRAPPRTRARRHIIRRHLYDDDGGHKLFGVTP